MDKAHRKNDSKYFVTAQKTRVIEHFDVQVTVHGDIFL